MPSFPDLRCPARLAVVAAVATASACGGQSAESLRPAQLAAARAALEAYGRAYERGDGAAVCRTLTTAMRRRYARTGTASCREGVESFLAAFPHDGLRSVRVSRTFFTDSPRVRGDVLFRVGGGGEVALARKDGRWRVDEDLSCITPGCTP